MGIKNIIKNLINNETAETEKESNVTTPSKWFVNWINGGETSSGEVVNEETAMKMGRGATAALQYFDEFDFINFQVEIMNAASFAYSTAAKNAANNGGLFGRILTSTPGDLDTRDGAAATEYISHMLKWEDKFFDEPIDKLKGILNSPSYNRF